MKNKIESMTEKYGCAAVILAVIFVLALAFGIDCLIVWGCMALWNSCLVGAVLTVTEVGYWQMWGIYLLCTFLVKAKVTQNMLSDEK
jgi:hypothetical protein